MIVTLNSRSPASNVLNERAFFYSLNLTDALEALTPHDHLSIIYETEEEWRAVVIPFVVKGLQKNEKCIYVVDSHAAEYVRTCLREAGIDVAAFERSGQLVILHETEAYTRDGFFDPDKMIALLIEEAKKALSEGYSVLRATGEMSWALRGHPGSEALIEYEAKLNRDFFPHYSCIGLCQYNRWQFDPKTLRYVIMTHPLMVRNYHIYLNPYYISHEDFLSQRRNHFELERWLEGLEHQSLVAEVMQRNEELAALNAISEKITQSLELKEVLDAALKKTVEVLNVEAGIIYLLDEPSQNLIPAVHHGFSQEMIEKLAVFRKGEWLTGKAAQTGAVLVSDLAKDLLSQDISPLYAAGGWQSLASVPLKAKDNLVGVMTLVSGTKERFRPDCVSLLCLVGNQIGVVIENAQLYEARQKGLTERERAEEALRESEKKYRDLVENMNDVIYSADTDGVITYISPAIESICGYTPSEMVGRSLTEFIYPEDLERVIEVFSNAVTGHLQPSEYRIVTKSGELRWIHSSSRPIFAESTVIGMQGMMRDVTKRKRAEKALRESEDRYHRLFEDSPISLWEEDFSEVKTYIDNLRGSGVRDFSTYFEDHPEAVAQCARMVKVIDINEATLILYKAERREDLCDGLYTIFGKESYDVFKEELIAIAEGKTFFESEGVTQTVTGEKNYVDLRWTVAPDSERSLSRVLVSIIDITEHKKAEEALQESEEKYRTFVQNLRGIAYRSDVNWVPFFFHGTVEEITGYSEQEFVAGNPRWDQVIHPDDWPALQESAEELRTIPNYSTSREYRIIRKDNEVRWVQEFIQNICDDSQNPVCVQGMIYDITEHKKAEEELMQLSTAVRMSTDSVIITDMDERVIDVNGAALKMYRTQRREDFIGKNIMEIIAPEDRKKVRAALDEVMQGGYAKSHEFDIITSDETRITIEINIAIIRTAEGIPKGIVGTSRDITERKKAEREMKRKLMRYDLEEGNLYLVEEDVPCTSVEAFQDLLTVNYPGLAISRTPKWELKEKFEEEFDYLWIAEKGGESAIPPDFKEIQRRIEILKKPSAIFIDRLDYLQSKASFKEALSFVQSLREIAYLRGHTIILSVDPSTLNQQELRQIEKEARSVEPLYKTKLPGEVVEILKTVYELSNKGVKPSYTRVGQKIGLSKPTIRKRIRTLINYGYLEETKKGRTKSVDLTEKGRLFFLK